MIEEWLKFYRSFGSIKGKLIGRKGGATGYCLLGCGCKVLGLTDEDLSKLCYYQAIAMIAKELKVSSQLLFELMLLHDQPWEERISLNKIRERIKEEYTTNNLSLLLLSK